MEAIFLEPIRGLLSAQRQLDEQRLQYLRENLHRIETFVIGAETVRIPRLALVHLGTMEIRSARVEMNLRLTRLTQVPVLARASNGDALVNVSMSLSRSTNTPHLERLVLTTETHLSGEAPPTGAPPTDSLYPE